MRKFSKMKFLTSMDNGKTTMFVTFDEGSGTATEFEDFEEGKTMVSFMLRDKNRIAEFFEVIDLSTDEYDEFISSLLR